MDFLAAAHKTPSKRFRLTEALNAAGLGPDVNFSFTRETLRPVAR